MAAEDFDGVINPPAGYDPIPVLSAIAKATGGPGGVMNEQATRIAANLKALKADGSVCLSPTSLGFAQAGALGSDANVLLGGFGAWDTGAPSVVRPAWGAIGGPEPGASTHALKLTGHYIDAGVNSAINIGGRPGYYNSTGPKGSLTATYGGDNYNGHLAGVIMSFHCDLIDDALGRGSHGAIIGGSYKQVASDYAGSFAGQVHKVFGLQSVAIGGRNIWIGDLSDSAIVRRAGTLGGLNLRMIAGYEGAMVGGSSNTYTSGDRSVMLGGESNEMAAPRAAIVAGSGSKVTADGAVALGGRDVRADIANCVARSSGKFAVAGDNQVYDITARREFTGITNFLSLSGGSGIDMLTPPAQSVGTMELNITALRKDIPGETASFKFRCSFSNIGGTLAIKAQTLSIDHRDHASYNLAAEIVGTGTRVGIRLTAPSADHVTRWTASGTITVQVIT